MKQYYFAVLLSICKFFLFFSINLLLTTRVLIVSEGFLLPSASLSHRKNNVQVVRVASSEASRRRRFLLPTNTIGIGNTNSNRENENENAGPLFSSPSKTTGAENVADNINDTIRADIKRMKEEATRRVEALVVDREASATTTTSRRSSSSSANTALSEEGKEKTKVKVTALANNNKINNNHHHLLDNTRWRLMLIIDGSGSDSDGVTTATTNNNSFNFLTSIIPKTWDERNTRYQIQQKQNEIDNHHHHNNNNNPTLRLQLEIELTDTIRTHHTTDTDTDTADTKMLRVVNNAAFLLQHDGRRRKIHIEQQENGNVNGNSNSNGGWEIIPHSGPLGTSLLRFYFNLKDNEELLSTTTTTTAHSTHSSKDKNNKSRVYCTCGYFPIDTITQQQRQHQHREQSQLQSQKMQNELYQLEEKFDQLKYDNNDNSNILSAILDRMKRRTEMMDIQLEAMQLKHKLKEESIRNPNTNTLRLSHNNNNSNNQHNQQQQQAGLTQVGDVSIIHCYNDDDDSNDNDDDNNNDNTDNKKKLPLVGKFQIAGIENRDRSNNEVRSSYRDLLP